MLHVPASQRARNSKRVTYAQNVEDAPHSSVTTRRKQREGRHLRPEFRGRFTRQRSNTLKTERHSSILPRISRMLHAPASRRAENTERVVTHVQSFRDALLASVTTRRKQQESRRSRPEFRGRSTRAAPTKRVAFATRISKTLPRQRDAMP